MEQVNILIIGGGLIGLPPLDGTLRVDAATLSQAADDFGHIVHRTPLAVLKKSIFYQDVMLPMNSEQSGSTIRIMSATTAAPITTWSRRMGRGNFRGRTPISLAGTLLIK